MLPKPYRLPKEDVQVVLKQGKRYGSSPLLCYSMNNTLMSNRCAVLISSRAIRLATKRNYVKRMLREAIRTNITALKPGHDMVFRWIGSPNTSLYIHNLVKTVFLSI